MPPGGGVDLCVTCYERTYREVLAPGYFPRVGSDQAHAFARRTAIINNVRDRADAEERARHVLSLGELDAVFWVEDQLAAALAVTGLTRRELGRAPYFADWGLVLVTVPGPDLVAHVDAEVTMSRQADWISPSIALMSPRSSRDGCEPDAGTRRLRDYDTLDGETLEATRTASRSVSASPTRSFLRVARSWQRQSIVSDASRCAATRWSLSRRSFEARVDAWIRHHGRLRATYRGADTATPDEIGEGYPTRTNGARRRSMRSIWALLARRPAARPFKRRCWRGL